MLRVSMKGGRSRGTLAVVLIAVCAVVILYRPAQYLRYRTLKSSIAAKYQSVRAQGRGLLSRAERAEASLPKDLPLMQRMYTRMSLASLRAEVTGRPDISELEKIRALAWQTDDRTQRAGFVTFACTLAAKTQDRTALSYAEKHLSALASRMSALEHTIVSSDDMTASDEYQAVLDTLVIGVLLLPGKESERLADGWWRDTARVAKPPVRASVRANLIDMAVAIGSPKTGKYVKMLLTDLEQVKDPMVCGNRLGQMRSQIYADEKLRSTVGVDLDAAALKLGERMSTSEGSGDLLTEYANTGFDGQDTDIRKKMLGKAESYYAKIRGTSSRAWAMTYLAVAWTDVDSAKAFKLLSSHIGGLREPNNLWWETNYSDRTEQYCSALAECNPKAALAQYPRIPKPSAYIRVRTATGMLEGLPAEHWKQVDKLVKDAAGSEPSWLESARKLGAVMLIDGGQTAAGLDMISKIRDKEFRKYAIVDAAACAGMADQPKTIDWVAALPAGDRRDALFNLIADLPPARAWDVANQVLHGMNVEQTLEDFFAWQLLGSPASDEDLAPMSLADAEKAAMTSDPKKKDFVAVLSLPGIAKTDPLKAIGWLDKNVKGPLWQCIGSGAIADAVFAAADERWKWATESEKSDRFMYVMLHGLEKPALKRLNDKQIGELVPLRVEHKKPSGKKGREALPAGKTI